MSKFVEVYTTLINKEDILSLEVKDTESNTLSISYGDGELFDLVLKDKSEVYKYMDDLVTQCSDYCNFFSLTKNYIVNLSNVISINFSSEEIKSKEICFANIKFNSKYKVIEEDVVFEEGTTSDDLDDLAGVILDRS